MGHPRPLSPATKRGVNLRSAAGPGALWRGPGVAHPRGLGARHLPSRSRRGRRWSDRDRRRRSRRGRGDSRRRHHRRLRLHSPTVGGSGPPRDPRRRRFRGWPSETERGRSWGTAGLASTAPFRMPLLPPLVPHWVARDQGWDWWSGPPLQRVARLRAVSCRGTRRPARPPPSSRRTSIPSLMTRAPRRRFAGRQQAAPAARHRARSIARSAGPAAPRARHRARREPRRAGRSRVASRPRPRGARRARSSEHLDPPECRADVLVCLAALACPGDTHNDGAAIAAATRRATASGAGASPSGAVTSSCHSTAVTASCNAGARSASAATPVTTIPSGNAAVSASGRPSRSIGSLSSTSRYSASDSWPTENASPKLTFGRGENPRVNESGRLTMRNARSNARATSRCPTKRTLPCFENRTRTGKPLSPSAHRGRHSLRR